MVEIEQCIGAENWIAVKEKAEKKKIFLLNAMAKVAIKFDRAIAIQK